MKRMFLNGSGKSPINPELGHDYAIAAVLELNLNLSADKYLLARRYGQIRNHQQHWLFDKFDHNIDERGFGLETRYIALMHYREGKNTAAPADGFEAQF